MKHQALFPEKDKSIKIKCRLLQFLFGALRVNEVVSRRTAGPCILSLTTGIINKSFTYDKKMYDNGG